MSNKTKAELLIMVKCKFFIWVSLSTLVLVIYNVFSVASQMQSITEGGYYTYTTMTLLYLFGVIEAMAIGSFMGGFDAKEKMIDYKLCNQSRIQWIVAKAYAIFLTNIIIVTSACLIAVGIDVLKNSIYWNPILMLKRFIIVLFVWILWACISFMLGLLLDSPGLGVSLSLLIFFGEQYIERYIQFPMGIMWNQKSLEHSMFHNDQVPFGVVQSNFVSFEHSLIYLIIVIVIVVCISLAYLKHKYPQK